MVGKVLEQAFKKNTLNLAKAVEAYKELELKKNVRITQPCDKAAICINRPQVPYHRHLLVDR